MRTIAVIAATAAVFSLSAGASYACDAVEVEDAFDLDDAATVALYECLEAKMAEGYAAEGDEIGSTFRDWTVTATRAAVAGPHGNRLLLTYANDIAADQYLKFEDEGVVMPVGSVLAKESITVSIKNKKARPGPLFIMTKLEEGEAPESGDWLYSGVQPNGKVMKVKQSFCHDCHVGWEASDKLAYPLPDVRIGATN